MRIIFNESLKILYEKSIAGILIGLILLNGILLYVTEQDTAKDLLFTPKAYRELWDDIMETPEDEQLKQLYNKQSKLELFYGFQIGENSFGTYLSPYESQYSEEEMVTLRREYQEGDYLEYSDSLLEETYLYRQVLDEIESCLNYKQYLQSIRDKAVMMNNIGLFKTADSFSKRNIEKTVEDFAPLDHIKPEISISRGITMATEFLPTDMIALVFIVLCAITLITKEKETALLDFAKTTYHGRRPLIGSKIVVIAGVSLVITLLLYGTNFIMAYKTYGFGNLDRPLQSLYGFQGSSLKMTILEYIGFFFLGKMAVYWLIGFVTCMLAVIIKSTIGLYSVMAILFAISGYFANTIPYSSFLSPLKYMNLVYFLNTYKLFKDYVNMNVFGYPLNYIPAFLVVVGLGNVIVPMITVMLFEKKSTSNKGERIWWKYRKTCIQPKNRPWEMITRIYPHEWYKIMIGGKAALIIFLMLVFRIFTYEPMKESFNSIDEYYYKQYMGELSGEVSDEKLEFLIREEERFLSLQTQIQVDMLNPAVDSRRILGISKDLDPYKGFLRAKEVGNYLEQTDSGQFVYEKGYRLLTDRSDKGNRDLFLALVTMTLVIACILYVYSVEYQHNFIVILRSTYHGRGTVFREKLGISIGIVTLIYLTIYGPYFYQILSAYGIKGLEAPAYSLPHLWKVPEMITIGGYLILISVIRYLGFLLSMMGIFWLSIKMKSFTITLIVSIIVFILPLLISMIGVELFDYVLLNPFLIGNIF